MLRDDLLRRFPKLKTVSPDNYVVGGAIRDLLLGVEPADVDVACTNAETCAQSISKRVIRLGTADHLSAWRVVDGDRVYDFADILDGDITADLARRDFTVNAMAVRLRDGELLDLHDGRGDLAQRVVRMIDATNFVDDPLRCLKAVRMALRFDFEIDGATIAAIRARAATITRVAAERVTYELSIIFSCGKFRRAVDLLHATALDAPLFGRDLDATPFQSDDISLAGAYALLVDNPKPYAKRWRWSVDLLRDVVALKSLVDAHDRIALYDAGERAAKQLPPVLRALGRDDHVDMPDFSTRALLSGEEIGLPEGPHLGRVKRALLEAQIRGEVKTKEEARAFVRATSST